MIARYLVKFYWTKSAFTVSNNDILIDTVVLPMSEIKAHLKMLQERNDDGLVYFMRNHIYDYI